MFKQIFIEFGGRHVRLDRIVEVTPENTIQLSTGTVLALSAVQATNLRIIMKAQYGVQIIDAPLSGDELPLVTSKFLEVG